MKLSVLVLVLFPSVIGSKSKVKSIVFTPSELRMLFSNSLLEVKTKFGGVGVL